MRAGDSRLQGTRDVLEQSLTECEGYSKCVVVMYKDEPDETFSLRHMWAGCTKLEARGMLATVLIDEA